MKYIKIQTVRAVTKLSENSKIRIKTLQVSINSTLDRKQGKLEKALKGLKPTAIVVFENLLA